MEKKCQHRFSQKGIILCMRPANERQRYNVTSPLIGWAHIQNDPCTNQTDDEPSSLCVHINSTWPSDTIWHYGNLVNIGSDNGLLPDGTKPLPEPMSTSHPWGLMAFTWGHFHRKYWRHLSLAWVKKNHWFIITTTSHRDQWVKFLFGWSWWFFIYHHWIKWHIAD